MGSYYLSGFALGWSRKLISSGKNNLGFLLQVFCLFALACIVHTSHDKFVQSFDDGAGARTESLVPSYEAVRLVSLGFDKLLADCYWLNFIGYYGDTAARQKDKYRLADRYLDLITSLDPEFIQPYWFVAFTVGNDQKNPERAAEILRRGIESNQNNWYLPFIAGFNQYMFARDELEAARYYRMASKFPDAPSWLAKQADILEAKIPSMIKEINAWTDVFYSVEEEGLKQRARERLIKLWMTVYKKSPSEKIKERAVHSLGQLGININMLRSPK